MKKKMECEEFNKKYNIYDVMEDMDKNVAVDWLVMYGLLMLVALIVVSFQNGNISMAVIIFDVMVIIGVAYVILKSNKRKKYVENGMFLDINLNLSDGNIIYQVKIDTLSEGDGSGGIFINGEFILNYDEYLLTRENREDFLLSFIKDTKVITPWGISSGDVNLVEVIYVGEYEIEGKVLPVLSILLTSAGIRYEYLYEENIE